MEEQIPVPKYMTLSKKELKSKKWQVTFTDASGQSIQLDDEYSDVQVTQVVKMTTTPTKSPAKGRYELRSDARFVGPLADLYGVKLKKRAFEEKLAKRLRDAEEKARTSAHLGTVPTQEQILERLVEINDNKVKVGSGNTNIMMNKVAGFKPVFLCVGGQQRRFDRLYTQVGTKTGVKLEIRCYLGNEEGAYQRVHTSLTREEAEEGTQKGPTMTAHTMVQTGKTVAVPPIRGGGIRIGFDCVEEKGLGFGERHMDIRSREQCRVRDYIEPQEWKDLDPDQQRGCWLMARTFNHALDAVFQGVCGADLGDLVVTVVGDDFAILDDTWLFGGKLPAAPEEEWKAYRQGVVVKGADDRDVVVIDGHRFAPNVSGIGDLGECFWDTLHSYGIDQTAIAAAADACGVVVNQAFDVMHLANFVNKLAEAGAPVTIVLTTIDIFSLTPLTTVKFAPRGGAAEELHFGFFVDTNTDQGHYVPELDVQKK